jgi:hypothetical protein
VLVISCNRFYKFHLILTSLAEENKMPLLMNESDVMITTIVLNRLCNNRHKNVESANRAVKSRQLRLSPNSPIDNGRWHMDCDDIAWKTSNDDFFLRVLKPPNHLTAPDSLSGTTKAADLSHR